MPSLVTKLLLLLAAAGIASAANYGEACVKDAECTEGWAPICHIYFRDDSYTRNTVSNTVVSMAPDGHPKVKGVCVACEDDCDCGVNEFCGIDEDAAKFIVSWETVVSENSGNGITGPQRKQIEVDAKSFEGIKIKSVCRGYDVPGGHCRVPDEFALNAYAQTVQEYDTYLQGDRNVAKVPPLGSIPKGLVEEDHFCGRVNTFAPPFHTVQNLGGSGYTEVLPNYERSTDVSTGNLFDTANVCRQFTVSQEGTTVCPSCLYNSNFKIFGCPGCTCDVRSDALCCADDSTFYEFPRWEAEAYTDPTSRVRRCSVEYPRQSEGTASLYSSTAATRGDGPNYGYRTCEQACQPSTSSTFEARPADTTQPRCFDANNNWAFVGTNTGDFGTFCECVRTCEDCVAANGGCGSRTTSNSGAGNNRYDGMYGTCNGGCVSPWDFLPPAAVTPGTSEYTSCAPGAASATAPVFQTTCLPACVECLANAHKGNCPNGNTVSGGINGCPDVTPKIRAWDPASASMSEKCTTYGPFTTASGFRVNTAAIDWEGWCDAGWCKICRETSQRCSAEKGIPQTCRKGRWVSTSDNIGGIVGDNNSLGTLLSISVFSAVCMLISLGVLVAVCIKTDGPKIAKTTGTYVPQESPPAIFVPQGSTPE